MTIASLLRKIINPLKVDVVRYPSADLTRRIRLINHFEINKILDVGANVGQYSNMIRKIGYQGKICSFEPLSKAFKVLEKTALKDKTWEVYNYALGDKNGTAEINVSKNLFSSSLLDITPTHVHGAPESVFDGKETISIKTLNSIFDEITSAEEVVFLKMDVQGFEASVIKGASEVLNRVKGIQIEMSLTELYKGEMLYRETIDLLESKGFKLCSLENGFHDKESGKLLQVDGLFFRED